MSKWLELDALEVRQFCPDQPYASADQFTVTIQPYL